MVHGPSRRVILAGILACGVTFAPSGGLRAEPAAHDFYKGRTLTIVTSTGAGGGYDQTSRLVARFLPRYLTGVSGVVVQNMPGGGNLRAANYMFEVAPRDGSIIGVVQNGIPLKQVLEPQSVRFDVAKFNWLGSTGGRNETIMVMAATGMHSMDDLKAKEVVLGGTGTGSTIVMYPAAMNNVLGTKFRIVTGYTSSTEVYLAMDRGEVMARSGTYESLVNSHPDWLSQGRIRILAQIGLLPDPAIPGVPLMMDLAGNGDDRSILELISSPAALGNPYYAPPGVPADRLELLSAALASTLRDPDFLRESGKTEAEIAPISGPEVTRIIEKVVGTPGPIAERARRAVEVKDAGPR